MKFYNLFYALEPFLDINPFQSHVKHNCTIQSIKENINKNTSIDGLNLKQNCVTGELISHNIIQS